MQNKSFIKAIEVFSKTGPKVSIFLFFGRVFQSFGHFRTHLLYGIDFFIIENDSKVLRRIAIYEKLKQCAPLTQEYTSSEPGNYSFLGGFNLN